MLNVRVKEARIKYPDEGEEESPILVVRGFNKKNKPIISEVKLDEIGTDVDRKGFNKVLLEALYKVSKG
jgi:hypothetical protein